MKPGTIELLPVCGYDSPSERTGCRENDFVQSNMYHREIRCSDCHDVHSNQNTASLVAKGNAVCLGCYTKDNPAGLSGTVPEHTHHAENSAGSQCTARHMPKIEQTIKDNFVSAHIVPVAFLHYANDDGEVRCIPNPARPCHTDNLHAVGDE